MMLAGGDAVRMGRRCDREGGGRERGELKVESDEDPEGCGVCAQALVRKLSRWHRVEIAAVDQAAL